MSERFLYSVNPKRPIRTIPNLPVIRTPRSLYLSIDEVKECLKYGSVYRRFANEGRNERVDVSCVDRFHNDKYMTKEEYEEFLLDKIDNQAGKVINNEVIEEVKEEEVAEEVVTEEEIIEEPENDEATEEEVVEEITEESVEELEVEDDETAEEEEVVKNNNYQQYKNYGGKNKKRH